MNKITNKDYFLPVIEALNGIKLLSSGTTKPMLIRGICKSSLEKNDYVVKYYKSPRMSVESSCRELIASFIAMELELNVPEPVLISVSAEFVGSLKGKDGYQVAYDSIGLNFGCKYLTDSGLMEMIYNQDLNSGQYEQAEHIFAFDTFISNVDRRIDKQNMLSDGETILIFDHELAFGFVFDLFQNPTPWIIRDTDREWIQNHFFFFKLKQNRHNFVNFVQSLEAIDDAFWQKVESLLPTVWKTLQLETIKNNLSSIVLHKDIFLKELYKILK